MHLTRELSRAERLKSPLSLLCHGPRQLRVIQRQPRPSRRRPRAVRGCRARRALATPAPTRSPRALRGRPVHRASCPVGWADEAGAKGKRGMRASIQSLRGAPGQAAAPGVSASAPTDARRVVRGAAPRPPTAKDQDKSGRKWPRRGRDTARGARGDLPAGALPADLTGPRHPARRTAGIL